MANEQYQMTAYAVRVGSEWFAGFGGGAGIAKAGNITKLKPGLCDAKLMWDHKKAASYVERLKKKGYAATAVLVTTMEHNGEVRPNGKAAIDHLCRVCESIEIAPDGKAA
jgi:hypothetical protein